MASGGEKQAPGGSRKNMNQVEVSLRNKSIYSFSKLIDDILHEKSIKRI